MSGNRTSRRERERNSAAAGRHGSAPDEAQQHIEAAASGVAAAGTPGGDTLLNGTRPSRGEAARSSKGIQQDPGLPGCKNPTWDQPKQFERGGPPTQVG